MKGLVGLGLVAVVALAAGTFSLVQATSDTSTSITRSFSEGTCDNRFDCWVCDGPVALDSVKVTVDTNATRVDAVKFNSGCTGHIDSLVVTTQSGDGIKVAEGVHDLLINGGSVTCTDKLETLHQDAVQIMGGENITFRNMRLNCGRPEDSLIDSNFFVNKGSSSSTVPVAIILANSWVGPSTAHSVNLQDSVRSGVRNSTICPGKFPKLTFTIGKGAQNPVNRDNVLPSSC
jgi:hypothetical protein